MRTQPHRTRPPRTLAILAAVVVAGGALPVAVHAQRLAPAPVRGMAVTTAARAEALEARASAIEDAHGDDVDLLASAALRESAARLRGRGDARALANLRLAAFGRYYAGDSAGAMAVLELVAARHAAAEDATGAVAAYLDAASVALDLGQAGRARRHLDRARRLAGSRWLSAPQREALQATIANRFPR